MRWVYMYRPDLEDLIFFFSYLVIFAEQPAQTSVYFALLELACKLISQHKQLFPAYSLQQLAIVFKSN